jgi:hypothetical protein
VCCELLCGDSSWCVSMCVSLLLFDGCLSFVFPMDWHADESRATNLSRDKSLSPQVSCCLHSARSFLTVRADERLAVRARVIQEPQRRCFISFAGGVSVICAQ